MLSSRKLRAETEISREEEDILSWWRDRKAKYPNLARLARKYLCVPATSTQAERVFSALGWLLNKRRLLLTGSHVNNQMFLKENLENWNFILKAGVIEPLNKYN